MKVITKEPGFLNVIYNGSFTGRLIEGQGVAAALCKQSGIQVFNEKEIDQIASLMYS